MVQYVTRCRTSPGHLATQLSAMSRRGVIRAGVVVQTAFNGSDSARRPTTELSTRLTDDVMHHVTIMYIRGRLGVAALNIWHHASTSIRHHVLTVARRTSRQKEPCGLCSSVA